MPQEIGNPSKAASTDAVDLVQGMGLVKGIALKTLRFELERCGRPAVKPLLRLLRRSPRREVRWEAAKALGHIGDPSSALGLVLALSDLDADVGRCAAEALAALGDAALRPLLKALLKHPKSAGLRDGARHVLRERKRMKPGFRFADLLAAIERGATIESAAVAAGQALRALPAPTINKGARR